MSGSIWERYDHREQSDIRYAQVRDHAYLDVVTYENHPWVFRDSFDGEYLQVWPDNATQLIPRVPENYTGTTPLRKAALIRPVEVPSLWKCCLRSLGRLADPSQLSELPVPEFVQIRLGKYLLEAYEYRAHWEESTDVPEEYQRLRAWLEKKEASTSGPVITEITDDDDHESATVECDNVAGGANPGDSARKRNAARVGSSFLLDEIRVKNLLASATEERQIDAVLNEALDICKENSHFELHSSALPAFASYFASLSVFSAHDVALKLAEIIRSEKGLATAIPLLHALITSAQILNSTKLRQFVKKELVEMHAQVFRKHSQHATLLSLCIAQTLMMEASYSSVAPNEALKEMWSRVISSVNSETSLDLQLMSIVLYRCLDEPVDTFLRSLKRHKLFEQISDGRHATAQVEFCRFLESYLHALHSALSPKDAYALVDALLAHNLQHQTLRAFFDSCLSSASLVFAGPELLTEHLLCGTLRLLAAEIALDLQRRKSSRKRKSDSSHMDIVGVSEALNAMVQAASSEDAGNDDDCKRCHRGLYRKIMEDFLTANAESTSKLDFASNPTVAGVVEAITKFHGTLIMKLPRKLHALLQYSLLTLAASLQGDLRLKLLHPLAHKEAPADKCECDIVGEEQDSRVSAEERHIMAQVVAQLLLPLSTKKMSSVIVSLIGDSEDQQLAPSNSKGEVD
ncbi:hypothetical protein AAVH_25586 [Aphelenchoides avenae]|nr:hypothetical protein AAVH_25586 [Aphelenchus avenae]